MKIRFAETALSLLFSVGIIAGCGTIPSENQVSTVSVGNMTDSGSNRLQHQPPQETASSKKPGASSKVTNSIHSGEQDSVQTGSAKVPGQTGQDSSMSTSGQSTQPEQGGSSTEATSGNSQLAVIKTPVGAPEDTAFVKEIFSVPTGEVALTIDDGPSPYTEQIISVLNQYHAKATFFFLGSQVLQYPDAVREAVASGDEIGDHTVTHPELTLLSPADQAEEIEQGVKDISLYDPLPITLFRPPYELMNHDTMKILARDHMKLALWNRDPKDWAAKNPQQIVQAILHGNPSGGVFDLHDKQMTLQALPAILQGLQASHLKIVVLSANHS